MKAVALFNLLFAFLAAAAAAAADINPLDVMKQLPQCGLACLVNGVTEHGCDIENFECQCNKVQEIIATVAPCLAQAGCGLDNITKTGRIVYNICLTLANEGNSTSTQAAATPSATHSAASQMRNFGWVGVSALVVASVFL